jgi:hypothetical protein
MTEYMVLDDQDGTEYYFTDLAEANKKAAEFSMDMGVIVNVNIIHRYTMDILVTCYQDAINVETLDDLAFESEVESMALENTDSIATVFEVKDHDAAQKDWEAMLEEWVRKHIRTPGPNAYWYEELEQ